MDVAIDFEFNGKEYKGFLSKVNGAGATSVFHLTINNFHYGRLRYTPNGWVFDTNKLSEGFETLANFFAQHLISAARKS